MSLLGFGVCLFCCFVVWDNGWFGLFIGVMCVLYASEVWCLLLLIAWAWVGCFVVRVVLTIWCLIVLICYGVIYRWFVVC